MSLVFSAETDLAVIRVSGTLGKAEFDQMLIECKALIKVKRKIKILSVIENFNGWENADGWDDMSFSDENDKHIQKIAIVGDSKWHGMAYLFTAKDLRPMPIEFFEENEENKARKWLNN
ncbi:MAG: STAS/SEC14 domain-containing protein [Cycloclasticus sp.]|nr:STAS/SEC14 domain-containing protein [Cycloclasticus sp.]